MAIKSLNSVIGRDVTRVERTGIHSHIRGLGVTSAFETENEGARRNHGLVGQHRARRAAALVASMAREGKISGRAVLLSGQPGSGKTALALAIARELGSDVPFTHMAASEVYSLQLSRTEAVTQALRQSMGLRIKEQAEVIEGEVVELAVERATGSSAHGPQGGRKGTMTLKTTDIESLYNLGPKLIAALERHRVTAGDVISIDKSSGRLTKIGRSILRSAEYECSEAEKFVNCPEGEIQKTREVVHLVSLHEIDVINSRTQGFVALFAGDTGEIKAEVRDQIDEKVVEWREDGSAELVPGVLFIDEVHLLDVEIFSFLNRALEAENAPLLIIATNRGITQVRGSEFISPHGIPADFLDRCLIIPTETYSQSELAAIIDQRITEEDIVVDDRAKELFYKIAAESTLRYGLQLLSMASARATKFKRLTVSFEDVQRVYELFLDVDRSLAYCQQLGAKLVQSGAYVDRPRPSTAADTVMTEDPQALEAASG